MTGTGDLIVGGHKYCGLCGFWHSGQCSNVKVIEYFPDGRIKRIEFHSNQPQPLIHGGQPEAIWPLSGGTTTIKIGESMCTNLER